MSNSLQVRPSAANAILEVRAIRSNIELQTEIKGFIDSHPSLYSHAARDNLKSISQRYVNLGRSKREFDYKSVIIGLYGVVESYISNAIGEYLQEMSVLSDKFSELPPILRNKHLELCVRLSGRVLQAPDVVDIALASIIKGAYECELSDSSSSLVAEAFSSHTANVRTGVIESLFVNLGVAQIARRASNSPAFRLVVQESTEVEPLNIRADGKFFHLDDLCLRRNHVAHGRVTDILSYDAMRPFLIFIEALIYGIDFVLQQEISKETILRKGVSLGEGIKIFSNSEVLGCPLFNYQASIGDRIGRSSQGGGGRYDLCEIVEIRVEGNSVEMASPGDRNVTFRIRPFIGGRSDYFLITT